MNLVDIFPAFHASGILAPILLVLEVLLGVILLNNFNAVVKLLKIRHLDERTISIAKGIVLAATVVYLLAIPLLILLGALTAIIH